MKVFFVLSVITIILFTINIFNINVYAKDTGKNLVNLAGYGFASCDSYEGESSIALAAVDGVVDQFRWTPARSVRLDSQEGVYVSTSSRAAWLQIEFEIPTEIRSAKIYWAKERAALGYYKLLYSDDGENWTVVNNLSVDRLEGDGSFERPIIDKIDFDTVKAKFYRVESRAGETKDGLGSIYEFELYGDPAQYAYLNKVVTKSEYDDTSESSTETDSENQSNSIINKIVGSVIAVVAVIAGFILYKSKKGAGTNALY